MYYTCRDALIVRRFAEWVMVVSKKDFPHRDDLERTGNNIEDDCCSERL